MTNWVCLKCGHKWVDESEIEPRNCPMCGAQTFINEGDVERRIEKGLKRYKEK